MIRILLADDEPVIIRGLKKLLDWEKMGIEIVGTASDGEKALRLVRDLEPDLLISDINMPELSGIELLKTIRAEERKTQVIFISGYNEFKYAHGAIRFGARDYLLKPINKTQLEAAILKALGVSHIGGDDSSPDQPTQEREEGYVCALLICLDPLAEVGKNDRDILLFSLASTVKEQLEGSKTYRITIGEDHIRILLLNRDRDNLTLLVRNVAQRIIGTAEEKLSESVFVSAGPIVDSIRDKGTSLKLAEKAMETRFFTDDRFLPYRKHFPRYSMENIYSCQDAIRDALLECKRDELENHLISYSTILADLTYGDRNAAISYVLGTLASLNHELTHRDMPLNSLDGRERDIRETMDAMGTIGELADWMKDKLDSALEDVSQYRESMIHRDIQKLKDYIRDHYRENITLQDLAEVAFMHPNYLSSYFKKHTGRTFKDYLTEIRILKAKDLLANTDLMVYQIAEKIGLSDYRHFGEVFKKRTGVTPSRYIKKHRKN